MIYFQINCRSKRDSQNESDFHAATWHPNTFSNVEKIAILLCDSMFEMGLDRGYMGNLLPNSKQTPTYHTWRLNGSKRRCRCRFATYSKCALVTKALEES